MNQSAERFGGYTTKTYNMLALALMCKNDIDKALKFFQLGVAALELDGAGAAKLNKEDKDVSCLIFNYMKCICIKRGQNM